MVFSMLMGYRQSLSLRHPIAGSQKGMTHAYRINNMGRNQSLKQEVLGSWRKCSLRPSERVSRHAGTCHLLRASHSWMKCTFSGVTCVSECILENWNEDITLIEQVLLLRMRLTDVVNVENVN